MDVGDGGVTDRQQLELAIAAQEGLRGVVPDEIVDAAVAALAPAAGRRRAPTTERRRQVTVLFADVSGFTSMSSRLDAEVVAGVMNELWARLDAVITDHGGRIDKHIGDAVMAVWGVDVDRGGRPRAGGPRRARHAGRSWRGAAPATRLAMRVGINTGPAHLGAVGASAEFTAMGDTVNVASRVESVAPLGGVLVTHDTYRHVRGVFDVEALDPALGEGQGRADPRVPRAAARRRGAFRMPTRGVEGVETRMIGRARRARRAARRVRARRGPSRDAAGHGHRRGRGRQVAAAVRVRELDRAASGRRLLLQGSGARRPGARPRSGCCATSLADRFGVLDSDSAAAVADKLRARVRPDARPPTRPTSSATGSASTCGRARPCSGCSGRDSWRRRPAPTSSATSSRWPTDGPVVVFLEDLHWADDESLAARRRARRRSVADVHLLVVGVGRPTLLERPAADGLLERSSAALRPAAARGAAPRELVDEILQQAGDGPGRARPT